MSSASAQRLFGRCSCIIHQFAAADDREFANNVALRSIQTYNTLVVYGERNNVRLDLEFIGTITGIGRMTSSWSWRHMLYLERGVKSAPSKSRKRLRSSIWHISMKLPLCSSVLDQFDLLCSLQLSSSAQVFTINQMKSASSDDARFAREKWPPLDTGRYECEELL